MIPPIVYIIAIAIVAVPLLGILAVALAIDAYTIMAERLEARRGSL